MATKVILPKLGLTMKKGRIVRWLKEEGDRVEKGEPLYEVETEKITNQIESPATGILFQILVPAGRKDVPVGAVLAIIAEPGEKSERIEAPPLSPEGLPETSAAAAGGGPTAAGAPGGKRPFVPSSPAARRLARELGVDISRVPGTGPGGRVTEKDVCRFHEEGPPPPRATPLAAAVAREHGVDLGSVTGTGEGGKITRDDVLRAAFRAEAGPEASAGEPAERIPLEGMRRAIAENMRESLRRTSQLTLHTEVDVTEALALIERLRQARTGDDAVRFSLTHVVVLAAARALRRFPRMNSSLVDDEIRVHDAVHVGIAVALPEGLIVPVLRDAHRKGLEQIAREVRDLARRARQGALEVDETCGGTFTVTSLAGTVVDGFTPILRPPETGILGVGRVVPRPVARDGEVCVRPVVTLSLTFDHGVIDGAPAAEFLGALCGYLEHPATLLA